MSPLRLLDDVQIGALPPPEWLVAGVLARDSLAAMIGPPERLKTFALIDVAFHVALGRNWHGRQVEQGPVVIVFGEGVHGVGQRVRAWKDFHGVRGRAGVHFVPEPVPLTEEDAVVALLEVIADQFPREKPVMIGIDTLARNFVGNENAQEDMGRYIAGCDQLRRATGACVVSVHHEGWQSGRGRGSTVLPAALDTEIRVDYDPPVMKLSCAKMKDAPHFPPIELQALPMAGSLVLSPFGVTRVELTQNERVALTALQTNGSTEWVTATAWKNATGLPSSSFYNAVNKLLRDAYVRKQLLRYQITESGREKLGPSSNGTPGGLQQVQSQLLQTAGGVYTPSVGVDRLEEPQEQLALVAREEDEDPRPPGTGEAWEPPEES